MIDHPYTGQNLFMVKTSDIPAGTFANKNFVYLLKVRCSQISMCKYTECVSTKRAFVMLNSDGSGKHVKNGTGPTIGQTLACRQSTSLIYCAIQASQATSGMKLLYICMKQVY